MLCSSDGFPYNFDIYCGKESRREGPLGSHVVNTLLAPVSNKNQHIVFFDNFFTSYDLLKKLAAEYKSVWHCEREQNRSLSPFIE